MTTHRERLKTCLSGAIPDRTPVSLWRHFPVDDQYPELLAKAHLAYQQTYDFDLVKVTPASSFCLKDWGAEDIWEGSTEGTRKYSKFVIKNPIDWERLPVLDPTAYHLAGQLTCLRIIRKELGPETPVLQTIFNPLAQAKHLVSEDNLLVHLRQYPEAVMKGLEIITKTTSRFIEAVLETGIDGIFYAVQHAQATILTQAEFLNFSQASDLALLRLVSGLWCNMLHLHGDNIYFDVLSKYPVHILNWHDRETPPTLSESQRKFDGLVCGGLSRDTLVFDTPEDIKNEVKDALEQTNRKRLILSTGCVVPITAPFGNIRAAQLAVH